MRKFNSKLYFITDSTGLFEDEFLEGVRCALEGGVTMLQLREKSRTTREYIELGKKVHRISSSFGVPLIIDDRADVALACGAEGVHLGADDLPIELARKILGENMIIGATAKTVEKALEAERCGADYLGVGAIFPTTTKVKTVITKVETLRDICGAVKIPVNAIGGLNAENIGVLKGVPVSGICVVSAIQRSKDKRLAAKELLREIS